MLPVRDLDTTLYVLAVQKKMATMAELVKDNLVKSQREQKRWYDRNARERQFQAGDQVLVLLPTTTNKLLAQWQGPYPVLQQVSPVMYEVNMYDKRKRHRIFHVNMLRKWNTPITTSFWSEDIPEEEQDEVPVWKESVNATENQPTISEQLDSQQCAELQDLLKKFPGVLQNKSGWTNLAEHTIDTGSAAPIKQVAYRLPYAYQKAVKEELQEMERDGIIEPSTSGWASPIVLIRMKDGTLRLCVDYPKVNGVSQQDAYPMPRMDEIIDRIGKAKFITTIDLTRGYWQVPMAEGACAATVFTTPFGLFQLKVTTFRSLMDCLINGMDSFAAAYLDDIVIYSSTWEEHLAHIRAVFEGLREAGLTVKPRKCQFGMSQCVYLGHIVGSGVVCPEQAKIQAVSSFPVPKTKKEVRTFLGLMGYYRRFIPSYATITAPLTDLMKKDCPNQVRWTPGCNEAFCKLKSVLCIAPVLHSPDFSQTFILQTDASDRGVGAVLSQIDAEGNEHPIGFFSRKLLPREQRYLTVEKECLAIKLGVQAFRVYLLGRQFVVQTDHRALERLDRVKEKNSRLTGWSLALQPYKFRVQYRAG